MRASAGEEFPALPKTSPVPAPSGRAAFLGDAAARGKDVVERNVTDYSRMLLDPFSVSKGHRYPDETIVPTALVNLRRSDTYTVGAGGTVGTALHWKLRTATGGVYVGTVAPPGTSFSAGEAAGVVSDYGTAQSSWSALTTVDRTLACGVRVRLVGLPTSTFLPSGTLYFLQIQSLEYTGATFDTEAECIQAVTARRGFSITANELSKMDGAIAPYLPQGPDRKSVV